MKKTMLLILIFPACAILAVILVHLYTPTWKATNSWEEALYEALEGTTHIEVGGYVEKDPEVIKMLIDNIRIDEARSHGTMLCRAPPSLKFYVKGELAAALLLCGEGVRWTDEHGFGAGKWRGDAVLTKASSDYIYKWLAEIDYPSDLLERNGE